MQRLETEAARRSHVGKWEEMMQEQKQEPKERRNFYIILKTLVENHKKVFKQGNYTLISN